jgi:alpha-glucosidase
MTNVQFSSIEDYNDVAIKNFYRIEMENAKSHEETMQIIWKTGRDNSRTPMQWNEQENAGFTDGTPWLKVNPNYMEINVEKAMQDPDSIYHYYKNLIRLRAENPISVYGSYDLILPNHKKIYAYTRTLGNDKLLVITNLFAEETSFNLPRNIRYGSAKLLLSNYQVDPLESVRKIALRPYESRVYYLV